jgi:hypothetical protein
MSSGRAGYLWRLGSWIGLSQDVSDSLLQGLSCHECSHQQTLILRASARLHGAASRVLRRCCANRDARALAAHVGRDAECDQVLRQRAHVRILSQWRCSTQRPVFQGRLPMSVGLPTSDYQVAGSLLSAAVYPGKQPADDISRDPSPNHIPSLPLSYPWSLPNPKPNPNLNPN